MTKRLLKKILMTVFSLFIVITLCTCSTMLEDLRKAGRKPNFTETPILLDETESGTAGAAGTYILFGDWPQTIKADDVIIDTKTKYTKGMFTYYLGSDGYWYVEQKEYAFRYDYEYSDGTIAGQGGRSSKYFKLEPIKWRVVTGNYDHDNDSTTPGTPLLLAENILQAMKYYDGGNEPRNVSDNNYEHSRVRAFLNGLEYNKEGTTNYEWKEKGFLQTAFTTAASGKILSTIVENDARSTNPANENQVINNGINDYASDTTTTDKIFLLSMKEATTGDYSFGGYDASDSNRFRKVTDYAIASRAYREIGGDYNGNGYWWLRSPDYDDPSYAYQVYFYGIINHEYCNQDVHGVVPALTISVEDIPQLNTYTVTFDSNGGSRIESQTLVKGERAQRPANPEKTGEGSLYEFLGWYNGDTEYNFTTPVTENITLKAKWKETPDLYETPKILEGSQRNGTAGQDGIYVHFGTWPQTEKRTNVDIDNTVEAYEKGMYTYYKGKYVSGTNKGKSAGWYVQYADKYYKLEPIKWRVVTGNYDHDNDSTMPGTSLLLAENILQGMKYYDGGNEPGNVSDNNYEHSSVRAFLNGLAYNKSGSNNEDLKDKGFLQTAFTTAASNKILPTKVKNDARSTNPADENEVINNGINDYASDTTTTDKIFLLSMQEITNGLYGFGNYSYDRKNFARARKVTDFAKVNSVWASDVLGNGFWWLRSPNYQNDKNANIITDEGKNFYYQIISSSVGVVPALTISTQELNICTVTFDTCGGSIVESQTLMKGEKAQKPADPTKTGVVAPYNFKGWYNGDTEYNFSTSVTGNITLKARWTATPDFFYETPKKLEGSENNGTAGPGETYYLFGYWPQTIKEDAVVIDNSTTYERGMFTYYPGSDGYWYVKQGEYACRNNYKYSDGTDAGMGGRSSKKYFKLEPIKWRMLNSRDYNSTGKAFLLAENILQAMAYYDDFDYRIRNINGKTIYPNNYEHSRVRAFLNGLEYNKEGTTKNDEWKEKGFLQTAFTDAGRAKIQDTEVDNSEDSTTDADNDLPKASGYAGDPTIDKIFLLSMKEATTGNYSFGGYNHRDSNRRRKVTDYAIASGAYRYNGDNDNYDGNGEWWLRSPYYDAPDGVYFFNQSGQYEQSDVNDNKRGVVPALTISLQGN